MTRPRPTAGKAIRPFVDLAILIVEAGLLSAFLGALVFVAGWSYAERFFAELGLGLSAIDGLEATSFSAFALWVFRDGWMAVLVFLVAAAFALALALTLRRTAEDRRIEAALVVAVLAVLALIGAGYLGSQRAERQVPLLLTENYHAFPRVVVAAKPESALFAFLADRGDLGCQQLPAQGLHGPGKSLRLRGLREHAWPPAEHLHPAALGDRGNRGRAQPRPLHAVISLRRGRTAPRRRGRARRGWRCVMKSSLVWRRARAGSLVGWASQTS